jgi:PKD repeat protein
MIADVPTDEDEFEVSYNVISGAQNGGVSIQDVNNGYHDGGRDNGNIERIEGLVNTSWTMWAESDVIVEFTLYERGNGEVPYEWTLVSDRSLPPYDDTWADRSDNANQVSPTGTYTGHITTPNDLDRFRMQLSEGENISMIADVPTDEDEFEVRYDVISGARNGGVSIQDVNNGYHDGSRDNGNIERIEGSANASWTLWAESDVIVEFILYERGNGEVPYGWLIQSQLNGSINTPPTASFTYDPSTPTAGSPVTFDATDSSDSDGEISKYEWDFDGDGTTDTTGVTATHTYETAGDYDASLSVTDDDGATNTISRSVPVEQASDPVSFEVEIDTTNSPVTAGQQLNVTATIENTGEQQATQETTLEVPGVGTDSVSVDLAGGESETVLFTTPTTPEDAGGYTATVTTSNDSASTPVTVEQQPAEPYFGVEIDTTNSPVTAGQQLSVTATIENTGGQQATQETTLEIPGVGTDSVRVDLANEDSETVTFTTPTTPEDVGEYTATVTTSNDSTSTPVTVEAQPGEEDPLEKYRNENGEVDDIGLLEAIADWRNDNLADTQLLELIAEWRDAG